jgi:anti-sigma regulatory factor (Ser/Thr protein kinase)
MGAEWSHTTEFAAEANSVSDARAFVRRHLLDHGMGPLVDDVELVVSELATNALVHAHTPFMVILLVCEGSVRLEVLDGSQIGPVMVMAQALDTGGRGVAIVNALSRDWGVIANMSGGKSVWAEFPPARARLRVVPD